MWSRRAFLGLGGAIGTGALTRPFAGLARLEAATAAVADRTPEDVAQDEFYWREIQEAFTLDRTLVNLNNGNTCPSPRVVLEATKRYMDMSNMLPVHYRGDIERHLQTVRRGLAKEFGCDEGEIALTRNASESLQIVQNGLDLEPGDEVITTEQDYPRMLTTWDQRMRRDKIKVTRLQFPVPTTQDDLYQRFERAITPQTRVLHFCHITNLTGQLFPVQRLSRLARSRGIVSVVDGAHALAHFPFKIRDLECDYYGVSLHKWLLAPIGNGLLYVRRENIPKLWPMQAVPERQVNDIRKFEAIGTYPTAIRAAVGEALAFHQAIGAERKAARLRYLTLRWANAVKSNSRVKILSSLESGQTWGLAMVGIDGVDSRGLAQFMMDRYRIVINAVVSGQPPNQVFDYTGLRVTPNVYTTVQEIDTFVEAMQDAANNGLPSSTGGRGRGN
ncbi:MAG TPA: aminotransferase class V-fold PLP-dependent enzyme, partial [Vicinamibacterales bacterium]|nr:aminotransferase class V-fold PLP-dependent enzyme [Vicinamibacterales bacterium]